MSAAVSLPTSLPPGEQRVLLFGVSWKEYCAIRELLDGPSPRMTYVQGALELMVPSPDHELWKTNIARLVELFALLRGIDLYGYGGATFKHEAAERGCEPDECYLVGSKLAGYPEIVLEVVHTNPLLDKLTVYAAMGVREVWVFVDQAFRIHLLDRATQKYRVAERSLLLPGIDFAQVARYAVRTDSPQAIREYKQEIEGT